MIIDNLYKTYLVSKTNLNIRMTIYPFLELQNNLL
jgi:hypothetical protein